MNKWILFLITISVMLNADFSPDTTFKNIQQENKFKGNV